CTGIGPVIGHNLEIFRQIFFVDEDNVALALYVACYLYVALEPSSGSCAIAIAHHPNSSGRVPKDPGPTSGVGVPNNTKTTARLVTEPKHTRAVTSTENSYRALKYGVGTGDETSRLVSSIDTTYRCGIWIRRCSILCVRTAISSTY